MGLSTVLQPDGSVIVAGFAGTADGNVFALARYTSMGQLDASFGSGGKVTTAFSETALGRSVVLQEDGKIVMAGAFNNLGLRVGPRRARRQP